MSLTLKLERLSTLARRVEGSAYGEVRTVSESKKVRDRVRSSRQRRSAKATRPETPRITYHRRERHRSASTVDRLSWTRSCRPADECRGQRGTYELCELRRRVSAHLRLVNGLDLEVSLTSRLSSRRRGGGDHGGSGHSEHADGEDSQPHRVRDTHQRRFKEV